MSYTSKPGYVVSSTANKRFERTRRERASLLSCVGEPLKRNVRSFSLMDLAGMLFGAQEK